jgi:anti-sigma B factor antagonist
MIVTKASNALIIKVESASITAANSKTFKKEVEEHLENESHVIFDLGSVTFIDSSGLGVFLLFLKRLNEKQGDLKLCNITKSVRVLFELVRLHQIIEIFSSQEEALQALKK